MAGAKPRTSFKSLFKKSEILPVSWQYIFSFKKSTNKFTQ
jgi:hypothetical protein